MRIAIIGPIHPYKGGIVQHTTELAHRLTAAGHEVEIISWRRQYPFFYPGKQFVDEPELPLHPNTTRVLSWRNPIGWSRWGRTLRGFDRIIFVWWVPTFQGPPYLRMLRALGKKRPHTTIICHNVLPHEPRPGDKQLARAVLNRCDQIIVHSKAEAVVAAKLTKKPVTTMPLPMPIVRSVKKRKKKDTAKRLLFFGFIRPYKGVDILLRALAEVPDVKLDIAGEIWGDPKLYTDLIKELGLKDRVTLHSGYVPINNLANFIVQADVVVLPYKSSTGSANISMAHAYGAPVIATKVGSLSMQVRDGIDGLLCEPDDVQSLVEAIKHFYEPGVAKELRKGVPMISADNDWNRYVLAIARG